MRNDFDISTHDKEGYIFIAATPRSGTQYIAHAFQASDIDVQHEAFGKQGIAAFHIIPFLANREKGIILHQVRDPLMTISSMQTISNSWGLIFYYTGIRPEQCGGLHAIMRLWLLLNIHIDKHEHFRYKIEDIESVWSQILNIANIPQQSLPDIPNDTHTRKGKYKELTWAELEFRDAELTKYIKDLSNTYGYEVD